ncbi:oxidoreductase, short-chain dehydrogenase family, putative [Plasmodium reichenowi]|uniref:Oxidoreductase, short-chain dehydrogenase family, putative n=1 Tax=Plasmodium reichenowi TaxID=5854 RepID=A0A2P9DB50_PLARE|nr:oxidoreductase, short-chain dehydrogenase family, putative [Plasmodium reichenowi]
MQIKNKSISFVGVMLTDPSFRRFINFCIISAIIWFIPLYNVYVYLFLNNYRHHLTVHHKIYEYLTNGIIITTFYFMLRKKNVGGTVKDVLKNKNKLRGKVVIITGGYKGIGLAAVIEYVKYGCEIILACRCIKRMEELRKYLLSKYPDAKINTVQLDLSSYESIEKCANNILRKFPKIDIIVNNAGTLNQTLEYINGLEHTFFVNYFGHFYLINLLYKRILACDTLVINMSSIAHAMLNEKDVKYDFIFESKSKTDTNSNLLYRREYNFSKLCMLYYTQQLQIRLEKETTKACTVSINPGLVKTDLFRNEQCWFRSLCKNVLFVKTPLQGAQSILYVSLLNRDQLAKGSYYSDCKTDYVRSYAKDLKKSEELWAISEKILRDR